MADKQEFYQLLNYTGDRNLKRQLNEWENFYNFHRPHTALKGKTPWQTWQDSKSLAKEKELGNLFEPSDSQT